MARGTRLGAPHDPRLTVDGAEAAFTGSVAGSIRRGKSAHRIVLDRGILRLSPENIDSAHASPRMLRGKAICGTK